MKYVRFLILLISLDCYGQGLHNVDGAIARCKILLVESDLSFAKNPQKCYAAALQATAIALALKNDSLCYQGYSRLAASVRNIRSPHLYEYDSLALSYALHSNNITAIFNALQLYATDLLNNNQISKSGLLSDQAIAIADSLKQHRYQSKAYGVKAFGLFKQFRMKDALAWYQKQLSVALSSGNDDLIADAKLNVAGAMNYTGRTDSSLKYFFEVLDYYHGSNDNYSLGNCYQSLAFAYQTRANISKAIEHYSNAILHFTKANEPIKISDCRLALGLLLLRQKKTDEALREIKLAENTYHKLGYQQGVAFAYNHLGQFYAQTGYADSARDYYARSSKIYSTMDVPLLNFATRGYNYLNELKSVGKLMPDSSTKQLFREAGMIFPKELIDSTTSWLVAKNGLDTNMKRTLKKTFYSPVDELHEYPTTDPYTKLDEKYNETIRMQYDSLLLIVETDRNVRHLKDSLLIGEQRRQIQQNDIGKRNLIINAGVVIVLLTVVALISQINYRKAAVKLKRITEHRIDNSLASITASMDEIKELSSDKAAFEQLRFKILPHTLLFQLMHQPRVDEVDMHEYLSAIASNLIMGFGRGRALKLDVDAPVSFPGKKALNVGLLVNELVTNSLKHAFIHMDYGHITIKIEKIRKAHFLLVSDNGKGLPDKTDHVGQGMDQIKALAQSLDANIKVSNESGTTFEFYFF